MELIENLRALENLNDNNHDIMAFSGESFPADHHQQYQQHQTPQLPINLFTDINTQSFSHPDHDHPNTFLIDHSMALSTTNDHFGNRIKKEKRIGGRKRKRNINEKGREKSNEVIHVRAKRGQATDSHSLAERTMGMAVMLDVVINYVQSLQTQIDFLSMKLSAASMYYDFNSPNMDAMDMMQGTNASEVQEMEKMMMREGYGGVSYFHSTWPL
ncbi:hypothetical protein FEM48_Zijuj10G0143100 [Ziziphus jujuba var. spinosa]|uniref:Transcription factor BEE 1-like n=1 Tax=Ziziphus jujuba var. spinosa TaxID=714518 RepID=A0A978UNW1_ZIZJJ|nr:hypothetical protein FEM48_Zijuj10G0143100 [Ziziphus jujuba var. spinosa]